MGASLEARKFSIFEYLANVEDEAIIVQIENLFKPKINIWYELSGGRKVIVKQGEGDLNEGKPIALKEFLA